MPLRPRQRRHTHARRACLQQRLRARSRRRSGRQNIVHQQHVPPRHCVHIRNEKSVAQICTTRSRLQACHSLRSSLTNQRCRRKLQPPLRVAATQMSNRLRRQRPRLVESPFRLPPLVQRNRNHQQLFGRRVRHPGPHLRHRCGQPFSQGPGRTGHPAILQRVDRPTHRSLVSPKTHRSLKRRRRHPASPAFLAPAINPRRKQQLPTPPAAVPALRPHLLPATFADRGTAQPRQGRCANCALGWKYSATCKICEPKPSGLEPGIERGNHHASHGRSALRRIWRIIAILEPRVDPEVAPQSSAAKVRRSGTQYTHTLAANAIPFRPPVPYLPQFFTPRTPPA